jgi:hypothetical protein
VLRWARVQPGKFLAVFERPLQGGAPRRIALVPYATIPGDAQVYEETFYRFSPDGQRLAWCTDYGVSVLEIATGVIRTLHAHKPKAADKTGTDDESRIFKFELKGVSISASTGATRRRWSSSAASNLSCIRSGACCGNPLR